MIDDGGGETDDAVAMREKPGEGIAFFADFEGCAMAQTLIEELRGGQRAFAQCHVGADAKPPKVAISNQMRILVAEGARALLEPVGILRVGCDYTAEQWHQFACQQTVQAGGRASPARE